MSAFPATRLRRLRRTGALRDLVRETSLSADDLVMPLFVAPDEAVLDVLNQFKRTGVHLAVVRESDGLAVGLVTLVDVLEAIVGDIPSLEDRLRPAARQRPDESWLVDGQYDLAKLAALLGTPIRSEAGATLAAFVGDQLAGHPREGDCFTCAGLRFEIIDMDRTSVDKVLIERAATPRPTEPSATAV